MNYSNQTQLLPITTNQLPPPIEDSILTRTVTDMINRLSIQPEMAMATFLTTASALTQKLFLVKTPHGHKTNLSIHVIGSCTSGSGKSASVQYTTAPIREFERQEEITHKHDLMEFEIENKQWKTLERKIFSDKKTDSETKTIELYLHRQNKPVKPEKLKIIHQTPGVLFQELQSQNEFPKTIMNAEGSAVLQDRKFKNFSAHCCSWSGEPFVLKSKPHEYIELDTTYSLCVLTQPGEFQKFFDKNEEQIRDSGFAARCLFFSASNIAKKETSNNGTNKHQEEYLSRCTALLELNKEKVKSNNKELCELEFNENASELYSSIQNEIVWNSDPNNPYGRFYGATDHAAKLMTNIVKIAGIIHAFNGYKDKISATTLQEATNICAYFSDQFRQFFSQMPPAVRDAMYLDQWLNNYRPGQSFMRKNFIRQNGPNCLRKGDRLNHALQVLLQNNAISIFIEEKTTWVNIRPFDTPNILPAGISETPRKEP